MSLGQIDAYRVLRDSSGSSRGGWQFQVGGGGWTSLGELDIALGEPAPPTGNAQSTIDLSAISALQNVAAGMTVGFRIVSYGATGTGVRWMLPNFQPGADLVVSGSVTAVPEASAFLFGGLAAFCIGLDWMRIKRRP